MTATLIIGQCPNNTPSSALLACVGAAASLGGDIYVLSWDEAGARCCADIESVSRVFYIQSEALSYPVAEHICDMALAVIGETSGDICHILAPADTFGKDIIPRMAALLDADAISDVLEMVTTHHVRRPCYAGNIITDVMIDAAAAYIPMTIRPSAYKKALPTGGDADVVTIPYTTPKDMVIPEYLETLTADSDLPDPLTAKRVISGGRGTGSKEGFDIIHQFAASLGECAVGASRAAVDAGYASNDMQIGQTGKIIAPDLYIAAGISGAIQHQAGIKDSNIIVAINTDENAPIFDIADIGLVADMFEALPALEALICQEK